MAPLATFYSLVLEQLLPVARRVEGFALLRTAQALGIVVVGLLLTLTSPTVALGSAASAFLLLALVVGVTHLPRRESRATSR